MAKYVFQQGGDPTGSDQFNSYVDNIIAGEQVSNDYVQPEQSVPDEDSDYIKQLRSYDEQQSNQPNEEYFNKKLEEFSSLLDEKLAQFQGQQQEYDWLASSDGNDYLEQLYNTQQSSNGGDDSVPYNNYASNNLGANKMANYGANPYELPANTLNPDSYLRAIHGNEGGKTGVDPKNVRGTATGRYAIINAGRKMLYNKYYKDRMSYDVFESRYHKDPNFEYDVAKKLAMENINSSNTAAEAFGRWYSPQHAGSGQWGVVPFPNYGNKLTVGQYAENAFKNYR